MRSLSLRGAAALASTVVLVAGCGSGNEGGTSKNRSKEPGWEVAYVSDSTASELNEMVAVSSTEGWAIGHTADGGRGADQVLLHRNGGRWRPSPLPKGLGPNDDLTTLVASAPDNVWLFGLRPNRGRTAAFAHRWNGRQWVQAPSPAPEGMTVRAAAATAPDDVWAVDGADARRWNGTRWTRMELPAEAAALDASAPNDIWAVGRPKRGSAVARSQPATMRWDGRSWRLVDTPRYPKPDPKEGAGLTSVVNVSRNEAWAAGTLDVLLRWDGQRWRKASTEAARKVSASPGLVPYSNGELVLNASWRLERDGDLEKIAAHKPVAGRSGKVTQADKQQKFHPDDFVRVPGSRAVWAVGSISRNGMNDTDFRRGAVLELRARGSNSAHGSVGKLPTKSSTSGSSRKRPTKRR